MIAAASVVGVVDSAASGHLKLDAVDEGVVGDRSGV